MLGMVSRNSVLFLLLLTLTSCSASRKDAPMDEWIEMEFIIDTTVDVQLALPPARAVTEHAGPQFITTSDNSFQRIFLQGYDPGWGKNRGLLLSRFGSSIKRIEPKMINDSKQFLEYVKEQVYLAREDAAKDFEIVGETIFNDHPWLQVKLISGYRKGIQYATILNGEYILLVSVSIFGEDSDQSNLYLIRHETLKKIVNSIRFSSD